MKKMFVLALGLMMISSFAFAANSDVLMKNCKKDGSSACVKAGQAFLKDGQAGKARTAFKTGCDKNHWESCGQLAFLLEQGKGGPAKPKQIQAAAKKACDHKDGMGCAVLGKMHETGKGVGKSMDKADALYRKACNSGCGMGCFRAGERLKDATKALEQYKDGCKKGCGQACFAASQAYMQGKGASVSPVEGAKYKKEACDKGFKKACK